LEIGKKLEERVAGLGHQDLVARIAEQAEDIGVALAGAGGQDDRVGIAVGTLVCGVVFGDGTARRKQSARLRLVSQSLGVMKRGESRIAFVGKAGVGRVRKREIE